MPLRAAVFLLLSLLLHQPSVAGEPPVVDFGRYLAGKYVYERNCIVCHGARGDGKGELSATLQPPPRSFREGMFKFRSTPFGALPTEEDLARTIRGGLSGTAMGMFTQLSDPEMRAVIDYVKSFSRRWRKAENYAQPIPLPDPPAWLADPAARAPHVAAGKALFLAQCASCHGTEADGKGPAAAALVDLWNLPTIPSDLRQPHLRCGDAPADLYRVLATGLNGTPMVSFDAILTPEERWEITAYIFTLRLPSGSTLGAAPPSGLRLDGKP